MTTIDAETLQKQLENGEDVCVVDIRSEDDYEDGHIEGSENRPWMNFSSFTSTSLQRGLDLE